LYKVYQPFFKYLRPYRRLLILATLCSIIAGASSGLGLPFILNTVLARAFEGGTDQGGGTSTQILLRQRDKVITTPAHADITEETALEVGRKHADELMAIPGVYSVRIAPQTPPKDERSLYDKIVAALGKKVGIAPTTVANYDIDISVEDEALTYDARIPTILEGIPVETSVRFGLGSVILLAASIPLMFFLRSAFGYAAGILSTRVAVEFARSLQQEVFDHLQSMPMAFFDTHQRGDLQTRLTRDTSLVQSAIIDNAPDLLRSPFQALSALIAVILLSFVNREIGFVAAFIIIAPVVLLPVRMLGRKLRKRALEWAVQSANIIQHLWENFSAIQEIRAFSLEEAQARGFETKLRAMLNTQFKVKRYLLLQQPSMEIVISLLVSGIFVYAWMRGIPFSTFFSFALALYFAFDPIKRIGQAMNVLHQTEPNALRLQEFFNIKPDITDPVNPKTLGNVRGEVVFNNVTFAYGDAPVLQNVSVKIPAGSTCALVGPSGAGKSTFAKLIPRFYEVRQGSVTLDNIDVRDVRQQDLRRQIAVVSQAPVLFDLTLMDNIRLGRPNATDEEVIQAAQRAHADEFIRGFEEGYKTLAGDRGDRLSGGQKQRIAIARAFLKNAPVLLLDEAYSALDSENEQAIQAALAELTQGRTVLVIAHRLSTIRNSSLILVFERGEIVAKGTHAELMTSSPLYQNLVNRQLDRPSDVS